VVEVLVEELDEIITSLDSVLEKVLASEAVELIAVVVLVVVDVVEEGDKEEGSFSFETVLDESPLSVIVVEDVVDEEGATDSNVEEAVDEGEGVLGDISVVLVVVVDNSIRLVDVFGFSEVEETTVTEPGVTTFVDGNTTVSDSSASSSLIFILNFAFSSFRS